jgi:RNA polymerase sigma-70 factor, ECF subfamily
VAKARGSGLKGDTPNDPQGKAIIERWRNGDKGAFDDLFAAYRKLVYSLLYQLLPDRDELEDVVQTAFLEIYSSLDRFEGRSKLSSWIARVTLHVGYHHLRYRRVRPNIYRAESITAGSEREDGQASPEDLALRKEAAARLRHVVGTLSARKRTVFILNDFQGLPQEEIAEIVGTNIATVRTRLFYARREFWKKIESDPVLGQMAKDRVIKRGT